jgi:hypothetical protein
VDFAVWHGRGSPIRGFDEAFVELGSGRPIAAASSTSSLIAVSNIAIIN